MWIVNVLAGKVDKKRKRLVVIFDDSLSPSRVYKEAVLAVVSIGRVAWMVVLPEVIHLTRLLLAGLAHRELRANTLVDSG